MYDMISFVLDSLSSHHFFTDQYVPLANGPSKGRIPCLSVDQKRLASEAIAMRTRECMGFLPGDAWRKFISPFIRETLKEYGNAQWETCDLGLTDQTFNRLYLELCDAKLRRGEKQNAARACALMDVCRHFLQACTTLVI